MKIINLEEEYQNPYFMCLEEWSEEMKDAGDHKEQWYLLMKDKGLGVKLAINENKEAIGMIQYIPIEHSHVEGTDSFFVYCIWVHGYEEGVGNYQKQGIGSQLLEAAEEDAKSKGAKSMTAWGVSLPFWMKASWFKKHGYQKVDGQQGMNLMWKPFTEDAKPPKWIKQQKKPEKIPGKVVVTSYTNGWCPGQNMIYERAKRAVSEFDDRVIFQEYHTSDQDTFNEWGILDGLYIDGKIVRTGPPPSFEKIKKKIEKKVNKLK